MDIDRDYGFSDGGLHVRESSVGGAACGNGHGSSSGCSQADPDGSDQHGSSGDCDGDAIIGEGGGGGRSSDAMMMNQQNDSGGDGISGADSNGGRVTCGHHSDSSSGGFSGVSVETD